jgi:DnaJ-class molecular chaperone
LARDPYLELGVARTASHDEVRKAFRKLAKQNHPDTNPNDKAAEERFKKVSAAFDIVGDPEKRKKFDAGEIDADGREAMRGFAGGQGPWGAGGQQRRGGFESQEFEGADLGDILGEMFGGRGGAGGRGGGFGGFSPARRRCPRTAGGRPGGRHPGRPPRIAFSDGRTIDVTIPKARRKARRCG